MNVSQKTITSALEELGAELGISEADIGGKVKIEGKDPVVASKQIKPRAVRPNSIPLFAGPGAPQGAITMCILGIFLGAILSGFAAAAVLKRFCAPASGPEHGAK